jgi:prepilin-type processing-associated H-X9-DG protein
MYADANTNTCPAAATWCDDVLAEVGSEKILQCPAAHKDGRSHYAYNSNLDGLDINKVKDPTTTVLIFESAGGWNLSGGRELLLQNSRHNRKIVVGFVDGHVEMINESDLSRLNWEP